MLLQSTVVLQHKVQYSCQPGFYPEYSILTLRDQNKLTRSNGKFQYKRFCDTKCYVPSCLLQLNLCIRLHQQMEMSHMISFNQYLITKYENGPRFSGTHVVASFWTANYKYLYFTSFYSHWSLAESETSNYSLAPRPRTFGRSPVCHGCLLSSHFSR